jgi:hypothetical protein
VRRELEWKRLERLCGHLERRNGARAASERRTGRRATSGGLRGESGVSTWDGRVARSSTL